MPSGLRPDPLAVSKKCAKSLQVVAIKAVAHKLARACFHVMKTRAAFDVTRAFG